MFRCSALICFAAAGAAVSAEKDLPTLAGKQLERTPVIDGVLAVGEWDDASQSVGFFDPVTGKQTADKTDVWLGYDSENIYVAFYLHDSDPSGIVGRTTQRGGGMDGDDRAMFGVDPFNRRASDSLSLFQVNPLGTKSERISGGRSAKREWRGEWQAAATITDDGWIAEFAIPWAMLDIPAGENLDMELNFARMQQRTKIQSFWADRTERDLPELDGVWSGITPPKVTAASKLSLQGYIAPEYDEDADDETTLRGGLDVRYKLSQQLTGVASFSPDFRNIEQEIAGIEFTRSERFVSDSRPFFTEGESFFQLTGPYSIGRMFHSRRIDDFDTGGKFFGQIDRKNSVGVLATREDGSRTDGVFKLHHQLDSRSEVSAYGTVRSEDGMEDQMIGSSGEIGRGNWGAEYDYAAHRGLGTSAKAMSGAVYYAVPKIFSILRFKSIEPGFDPALGFVPFDNQRGGYIYSQYDADYRTGPLRELEVTLFSESFETFDNHNFSKSLDVEVEGTYRNGVAMGVGFNKNRFMDEETEIAGIGAQFNVDNPYSGYGFSVNDGTRDGDSTTFLRLNAQHRFTGNIDLSVRHSALNFQGSFDQTIVGLGWEIDKQQAVTGRYVSQNGNSNWYVSYRKAGYEGLEWFAIIGDPNASEFRNRVAIKVVWAQ